MATLHPSTARGHADHGWLKSFHSFSFANYRDPSRMNFSCLRVINEDRVEPGRGFGKHGHQDMEIITYVLSGELQHQDSTGTNGIIKSGDVQHMSAGRGIFHSEMNPSQKEEVHLLQCWIEPDVYGIEPHYDQRYFSPKEKRGKLRLLAAPLGKRKDALPIRQDAYLYAGIFDGSENTTLQLNTSRWAYVQVARGMLCVNDVEISAGDALQFQNERELIFDRGQNAEILVFDLPEE